MAVITIKIQNKDGMTLSVARGEDEAALVYTKEYEEGDEIIFEISPKNAFYELMADDALGAATVYVTGDVHYRIPFGERKISYSPKTFSGNRHLITAKLADMTCFGSCRNLAKNVMDQHGETNCYPHASANVETRGELVFAACNAIDGFYENTSHGMWPYQSWGINRNPNATMLLEFGRPVLLDELRLTLRADFPHDSWWTSATVTFSDDSTEVLNLGKSCQPQRFPIKPRCVEWLRLEQLIKANDDSPFPALTQIEAWGTEGDR